jgi:DNA-binding MarR family transcriptional regulator
MTKILRRLEQQGLVERARDPEDGRGSLVSLTDKGLALQEEIFLAFLAGTQELLEPLSETALKDTDGALRGLLEIFEGRFSR